MEIPLKASCFHLKPLRCIFETSAITFPSTYPLAIWLFQKMPKTRSQNLFISIVYFLIALALLHIRPPGIVHMMSPNIRTAKPPSGIFYAGAGVYSQPFRSLIYTILYRLYHNLTSADTASHSGVENMRFCWCYRASRLHRPAAFC